MTRIIFNAERFALDFKECRGGLSQQEFADKLGIHRSTVSLFENAKQLPTLETMRAFCETAGKQLDIYFVKEESDPVIMMMGQLKEVDRPVLNEVVKRIKIREQYISILKRCERE